MTELAITTFRLTRRFGDLTAVADLDLQVPGGSVYGFLGPNGAGKTTTIRLLLGLIRPNAGEVRLFGQSLRDGRMTLLRRVGALVETPSLYPHLTGRENLEVTRRLLDARQEQINRALAIVKLEQDAHRQVSHYSSGMKQRLGLALALLGEPELLVLDEPTSNMDNRTEVRLKNSLSKVIQEKTLILITHRASLLEMVDRLVVIDNGAIVADGPKAAVIEALKKGQLNI